MGNKIAYTEEMVGDGHPTKADTLNRYAASVASVVATEHSSGHHYLFPQRSRFRWKDKDEIYVGAGCYAHPGGTTAQPLYWTSELTIACASATASQWYYLYLDDSNIANTLGSNSLTATQFVFATTTPTFNATYRGWYNGNDLCIFAGRTNAGASLREFWHDGGNVVFYHYNLSTNISASDIDTTWVVATLTVPSFGDGTGALAYFQDNYQDQPNLVFWRKNGSSASGQFLGYAAAGVTVGDMTARVICDADGKIEVKHLTAGNDTITIYTCGYYFPQGM